VSPIWITLPSIVDRPYLLLAKPSELSLSRVKTQTALFVFASLAKEKQSREHSLPCLQQIMSKILTQGIYKQASSSYNIPEGC
jgi:hypothetical protein